MNTSPTKLHSKAFSALCLKAWLKASQPQRLSLRLILVAPFVLEIILAVGLTGYLSFRNGQKAVNDLAGQLQQEVSDRIDQHLDSYLSVPPKLSQLNASALQMGILDPTNIERLDSFSGSKYAPTKSVISCLVLKQGNWQLQVTMQMMYL